MATIQVGAPAPDFTLPGTTGTVSLADFIGKKKVVLYFYPQDSTPGCTNEAREFREVYAELAAQDAVVLGVSRNDLKSHEKFIVKLEGLPFPLLADTESIVCTAYDVIKDKNMYGKMVKGIERSTFLIDKTGSIAAIWRKVKVGGHARAVLAEVEKLV
jgi:thioredoxin-dependent peroxiredoxin